MGGSRWGSDNVVMAQADTAGDRAGLSTASSEELVSDKYAVQKIPIVETNGWFEVSSGSFNLLCVNICTLTIWNCIGITRKLSTCTSGHTMKFALSAGR